MIVAVEERAAVCRLEAKQDKHANATALKEVWERLDGKTLQTEKLQLGGADGKQVLIKVVYGDQKDDSSQN